jgi:hypothetical protein
MSVAAVYLLATCLFYPASVPRRERDCAATDPGKSRRNLLQHRKIETHAYAASASANGLTRFSGHEAAIGSQSAPTRTTSLRPAPRPRTAAA